MPKRDQTIKDREALLVTLRFCGEAHFRSNDRWYTPLIEPGPTFKSIIDAPLDELVQLREAEFEAMRWYRTGESGNRVEHCVIIKGRVSAGEWHLLACVTHGMYAGELPDFGELTRFMRNTPSKVGGPDSYGPLGLD